MNVVLFTLMEDNTTGSFYLCHLLSVPSMISKSGVICTSVYLYTVICTDGMAVYMSPCMLLIIPCSLYYFLYYTDHGMCINVDIPKLWITSMLLFASYNITTSSFFSYCKI